MERLRDEPLHERTPHRATDCSDQLGCRLKDESTTPPYQRRPGTASGIQRCCGRKPQHRLRCVRSHPMDWGHACAWDHLRGVRRLPAPVHRLLLLLRQSGLNSLSLLFLFGRWSSAKGMITSSFIRQEITPPTEHIPNIGNNSSIFKGKRKARFEI